MNIVSEDDFLITVEEARTGVLFHFGVGPSKGLRYLGAQTANGHTANVDEDRVSVAKAVAREHAEDEGWLNTEATRTTSS